MNKLNITVIIFSTNSEAVIERALRSVTFADEVIVYDTGSTDRSVALAKKHTKKVIEEPYSLYVELVRQKALKHAAHEWVFFLDADEELPDTIIQSLEQVMTTDVAAVRLPRKNIIFGQWMKHTNYWPDYYNPRFFRKDRIHWHMQIHSNPTVDGVAVDLPAKEENAIIHYHYTTISEFIDRMNRYTTAKIKETGADDFSWDMMLTRPAAEFFRRYFYYEGYKDGLHGLAFSLLLTFYELVAVLKLWEAHKFTEPKEPIQLKKVRGIFAEILMDGRYWFREIALKETKNVSKKLLLRIGQKISTVRRHA